MRLYIEMLNDLSTKFQQAMQDLQNECKKLSNKYPTIEAFSQTNDPDVKILLESFALLYAKIHDDIKCNEMMFPNTLLNSMYPELITHIPSMSIIYVQPKSETILPDKSLVNIIINNVEYKFHTIADYTINNIILRKAEIITIPKYAKALSINIDMSHPVQKMIVYINASNASDILAAIINGERNVYVKKDDILQRVGYVRLKEMPAIYNHDVMSPYYHLYNYSIMPQLYQFVEITFAEAIETSEIIIPITNINISNLDPSDICINHIPIINLYQKTSDPIHINVPEQSYKITAGNSRIYHVKSISICDQKTDQIIEYDWYSKAYFISTYDEPRIFLSKNQIQWHHLNDKIIYGTLLCCDEIPFKSVDKIIVKNVNSNNICIMQPTQLRVFNHSPDMWLMHSTLQNQIYTLQDHHLLSKIIDIGKTYNINFTNIIEIKTSYEHSVNKSENGWHALIPKRILHIRVNHESSNFIKYIALTKTLMNLSGLDYLLEVRFIDQNCNDIYSEIETR